MVLFTRSPEGNGGNFLTICKISQFAVSHRPKTINKNRIINGKRYLVYLVGLVCWFWEKNPHHYSTVIPTGLFWQIVSTLNCWVKIYHSNKFQRQIKERLYQGEHESYVNEYMKDNLFELRRMIWRYDWLSQLYTQLVCITQIKAWKKNQAWTWFKRMTSAI